MIYSGKKRIGQLACVGILCLPILGHAATEMPAATGASTTFAIKGFDVTGEVQLTPDETHLVLRPFIGPGATIETLQKATAALEAAYKSKGYALHRVSLPPQEVGNQVKLIIVKFVIGKVNVVGHSEFTEDNIRASLPELTEGKAPNFSVLAVQTALANENPSKQIKVTLRESDDLDKINALVQVKEAKPFNFLANLANTGSQATGQDRLTVVVGHSNLWGRDHQLSGAYTTSMERSSNVRQLGGNYRIPFYQQGGMLEMSYTASDVVGNFGTFTSTGAGQTYGISYSMHLWPKGGRRTYLTFGLDEKQFNSNQSKQSPLAEGQPEKLISRPVSLGYVARIESDTAVWGYNAELLMNFPGGSGNNLTDYQNANAGSAAPNLRIDTVNWKVFRGGANYLSSFSNGWVWSLRGQFQISPDALISGEQFGLGGSYSVRGTGERPISGDSGLFASLEITTPALTPGLTALVFADGGFLTSHHAALSPTETDRLASAGLGLRFASGPYGLTAHWARVMTGSSLPVTMGPSVPQSGDTKLHLNATLRF